MARRVDLVGATGRSAGVQCGASGSVEWRGAASRSAESPLKARRAARLTVRRMRSQLVGETRERLQDHFSSRLSEWARTHEE